MNLTIGELLAVYAIVATSRAPGAKKLARRVREVYEGVPRDDVALVEVPVILDVSSASTLVRPQYDHEGPVPVALGFQPNEGTSL